MISTFDLTHLSVYSNVDGNHRITMILVLMYGYGKFKLKAETVYSLSRMAGECNVKFYFSNYERNGLDHMPLKVSAVCVEGSGRGWSTNAHDAFDLLVQHYF